MASTLSPYKVLDSSEIDMCRQSFIEYDADHSGTIDPHELKAIMNAMGQSPSDEELQAMIYSVDDNVSVREQRRARSALARAAAFEDLPARVFGFASCSFVAAPPLVRSTVPRDGDAAAGGWEHQSVAADLVRAFSLLRAVVLFSLPEHFVPLSLALSTLTAQDSGTIDFHEFLLIFAQHKVDAENTGGDDDVLLAWTAVKNAPGPGDAVPKVSSAPLIQPSPNPHLTPAPGEAVPKTDEEIKAGFVDTQKLIKILAVDFNLALDIEGLLREVDTSGDGKVDYEEFKM